MIGSDFGKSLALAAAIVLMAAFEAPAQQAEPPAKPGKLINAGDILSGQLNAMRMRGGKKGKRVNTYQLVSEPRRLPPPNGLCNLETGPETDSHVIDTAAMRGGMTTMLVDAVLKCRAGLTTVPEVFRVTTIR